MKNKYLPYLLMLYVTVKLIILTLSDKITVIYGVHVAVGSLVIPVWFVMGDIISEVYGYKIAKTGVYWSIICQLLFAVSCAGLVHLDSPPGLDQMFYTEAYDRLIILAVVSCISVLSSGLLNAYILSKWKILLKGKYFILRSLGSSAIGELIFSFIAISLQFYGMVSISTIFELFLVSLSIKLIVNPLVVIPSAFFVALIKNNEKLELASNYTTNHPLVIKPD